MNDKRVDTLVSFACYGAATAGTVGVVTALISVVMGNMLPAGVAVVGSALAFGLLANAILRN
jgi:hypothetical protein